MGINLQSGVRLNPLLLHWTAGSTCSIAKKIKPSNLKYVCVYTVCVCDGGGPQLTFHHSSVISQSLTGTECASFLSTQCLHLLFIFSLLLSFFFFSLFLTLLRFDIYRKVPKDLTQPTYTGAFSEYFVTLVWPKKYEALYSGSKTAQRKVTKPDFHENNNSFNSQQSFVCIFFSTDNHFYHVLLFANFCSEVCIRSR